MTTAGMWLDFVNREDWGAANFPIARRLSSMNVIHVLLHHTATENCFDLSQCKMFVYDYQVKIIDYYLKISFNLTHQSLFYRRNCGNKMKILIFHLII